MWRVGFLVLLCRVWGCGERVDELTPYVLRLQELEHFNEKLVEYEHYLSTEGMTHKASDIAQVLAAYQDSVHAIGKPDDKRLMALHNEMLRTFDEAQRKLVEPDFPTFVPNAQKAVTLVRREMIVVINNLERLWEREGKTEPFSLSWPQTAE